METQERPGDLVSFDRIGIVPHVAIRALAWQQRLAKALPTERGVTLHRLNYRTTSPGGDLVLASALVAIPRGRGALRGIVGWQHGTESLRSNAPSRKHLFHGVLPAALFAGRGYVLVASDYLGYGISQRNHDYFLASNMASVVRDGLQAAIGALVERGVAVPERLFLAGFSEGGHATLATHRFVESRPLPGVELIASAPIAAPVDLVLGVERALEGRSRFCSLYVAWIAVTYAREYQRSLSSVLTPSWAAVAESLFDGRHDGDTTVSMLPVDPAALLNAECREAVTGGSQHWFVDRLRENSVLDWLPRAPIRTYYGTSDVDVDAEQALLLERNYGSRGADATAVCVGDVDHDATIVQAAPLVRSWFDSLAPSAG